MTVFDWQPLKPNGFGRRLALNPVRATADHVVAFEAGAKALLREFHAARGLLVLSGLTGITREPELLVRLSRLFGSEVEDYRGTPTARTSIHPQNPEIFIVSNAAPVNRAPPARPDPPLTEEGGFPIQFPHRRGWHTDQSYRRPPPDISLFYCVEPAIAGQAQTLYADGVGAYATLSKDLKARIDGLDGIHVMPGTGRGEMQVRAGDTPRALGANEQPQRQPVVRHHPVTGEPALYLCEAGQMDWIQGPFVGMEPGPDGEGGKLLYELMRHYTRPEFVHTQEWSPGDLVIYDNRCTVHAATWFDAETYDRVMWRTTVWGNPGSTYVGEARSWETRSG